MTDLTKHTQHAVIQKIFESYPSRRKTGHRPHLGGSQIGHHCSRYLWYQFRWADSEDFSDKGRLLRLFDHGEKEEERIVEDLRAIGASIYPIDPQTGKQWLFSAFGGHFGMSLDATGNNFPDTKAWRLLEFKTANDKSYKQLIKSGVKVWNPQYYAQVLVGMELSGLQKCLHITVNKNTDEMYAESIKPNSTEAAKLLDKAERVIFSEEPLQKCTDNPAWYKCKWCPMFDICWGNKVAQVNMRTCAFSTPTRDGDWYCEKCKKNIPTREQATHHHLMRPDLVPYAKAIEATDDYIKYEGANGVFYNSNLGGEGHYTSQEMRNYDGILPIDKQAEMLRQAFNGEVIARD